MKKSRNYEINEVLDDLIKAKEFADKAEHDDKKWGALALQLLICAAEWGAELKVMDDREAAHELVEEVREYISSKLF